MVIERKEAGKYDTEAERAVQPPAYAYVAPPGQSNNYGSWSGGVWHWLPEYLILSHLLRTPRGIVTAPDYQAYYGARQRGETLLSARTTAALCPAPRRAVSVRRVTLRAIAGLLPSKPPEVSHGYAGSQYQSRGGFAGSRYQSRGSYQASQAVRSLAILFTLARRPPLDKHVETKCLSHSITPLVALSFGQVVSRAWWC